MKVKVLVPELRVGDSTYQAGEEVDIPEAGVARLIRWGYVARADRPTAQPPDGHLPTGFAQDLGEPDTEEE